MKPSALLGLIVLIAAGYYIRSKFSSVMTAVTSNSTSCLEMMGSTTTEEEGQTYITGSFKNNCGRDFGNVTVNFKLDAAGTQSGFSLGSANAYANNVKVEEIRQFKSTMAVSKDATYQFEGFVAF